MGSRGKRTVGWKANWGKLRMWRKVKTREKSTSRHMWKQGMQVRKYEVTIVYGGQRGEKTRVKEEKIPKTVKRPKKNDQ